MKSIYPYNIFAKSVLAFLAGSCCLKIVCCMLQGLKITV